MKAWARNSTAGVALEKVLEEVRTNALPPPPFDQAELIGCIAPRAFFTVCASEDKFSHPESVLDVVRAAQPYFAAHGDVFGWDKKIGPHSIDSSDWRRYCDFAEFRLGWK